MRIEIPQYKHLTHRQEINLGNSKICTLIGGNGSGKSTILESIFSNYIEKENIQRAQEESLQNTYRCIVFSSGQNELFSRIFNNYEKNVNRFRSDGNDVVRSFYFDYWWSRLLIFFTTSLKPTGKVRKYLVEHNYIDVVDNKDTSSFITVGLRVRKPLVDTVMVEHDIEERGDFVENSLIRSLYLNYLEKVINAKIDSGYSFREKESIHKIISTNISIKATEAKPIFNDNPDEIFTFFARATGTWLSNFQLEDISLCFKNSLELRELSDGEYQLLSIYALIDLFDDENTIFLLDEVDSHLHRINVNNMWNTLNKINGKVIATSHLSSTILNNDYSSIKFIQNGMITTNDTAREIFSHIQELTKEDNYYLKLASKVSYIALLDDEVDWIIFKELVIKKIGNESNAILSKVIPYKRGSSFNTSTEIFGRGKLEFIKSFKESNQNINEISTRHIFCICDRDELPLTQISDKLVVSIHDSYKLPRDFPVKTYLLSWRRREIENYLLSRTMLTELNKYTVLKRDLPQVNFDNIDNFDESEDLRKYDAKLLLHPLYKENGFDYNKLKDLINRIPIEEISEDIVLMYGFIKDKVERT